RFIEEPCNGKPLSTVLKTNGVGDNLVEFTSVNTKPPTHTSQATDSRDEQNSNSSSSLHSPFRNFGRVLG
ncbi:MAG: hypothetical protein V7L11_28295, partial [Nostoc sp.]|uniref:hypothetical protein n=1 Tax=Nostoc sp. TaxID=1180 RepID=UPI002FF92053